MRITGKSRLSPALSTCSHGVGEQAGETERAHVSAQLSDTPASPPETKSAVAESTRGGFAINLRN
jgi:hypothetical protein